MHIDELANLIKKETGYNKKDIKNIIDAMTTCIGNSLIDGEDVHIYKFGTFKLKHYDERKIRNITTGKVQIASGYNKIVFEPTRELKKAIK